MTDLALLSMFIMFVALGFLSPFVWSLGYVWVDVLLPHRLSYSLLSSVPVAFIMGAGAVVSYLVQDRRDPPRLTAVHVLVGVLAIWITLTSTWAVSPAQAWYKWDSSFKTLIFAAFMPFVFRTRVQIEAYLLVLAMAATAHLLPWGFKTALTGGGYQMSLGLLNSNATMLSESSAVAAITVMFVPLLVWARTHSLIIPVQKARTVVTSGLIVLYLIANIGTFARTGLIGLALLGGGMLLRTRRKLLYLVIAGALGGVLVFATSDRWLARVSTISDYQQESSAYTRILIWKWTLNFVASNPLGGGFNAYVVNVIVGPPGPNGEPTVQFGRAFHNIFFAALGEHGIPGFLLYVTILLMCLVNMQRLIRRCRDKPDLTWAADLARATQLSLVILMACGNFVDISFSFIIWNLVSLAICLQAHVQRVLEPRLSIEQQRAALNRPTPDGRGPAGERPVMPQLR